MTDATQRLVVLGTGFGGYSLISRLPRRDFSITVVSPRNYFLFYPLLASATVGTVEFRSIVESVPGRLSNVRLLQAEAVGIDFDARTVECRSVVGEHRFRIDYERLVIAVGAAVADYGVPGVREHCLTLRSIEDARAIRTGVLERFAEAQVPGLDADEVRRRLTVVVCGGGPTGVEVAAEISDLLDRELARDFPELAPLARVVLVEALPRLLTGFDEALSGYARENFLREGIDVRLGAKVAAIAADRVVLADGDEIPCGLTIWAAGNAPRPLVAGLDEPKDERGRLLVDGHLRLVGHPEVHALGDCAAMADQPLPATAQVAQQEGKYLARALRRERRGRAVKPFHLESSGMLAYVGGGRALADLPQVKWSGRGAWFFWRSVYVTKLVSNSNKLQVLFDWLKNRLFGRDTSRFG
ncbi:MAG TPA: FAD-dependent oxidoreductase [Thermoanaerobaculia bacterium]|nr:FAD-dependent oxidoreductase [Thermoanaerobaculia bacterium]